MYFWGSFIDRSCWVFFLVIMIQSSQREVLVGTPPAVYETNCVIISWPKRMWSSFEISPNWQVKSSISVASFFSSVSRNFFCMSNKLISFSVKGLFIFFVHFLFSNNFYVGLFLINFKLCFVHAAYVIWTANIFPIWSLVLWEFF